MLTREQVIKLISEAKPKVETFRKVKEADIVYETDRENFIDILNAETLYYSIKLFDLMDTAAREQFIEIIGG